MGWTRKLAFYGDVMFSLIKIYFWLTDKDINMSLRTDILDAVIDGDLGHGVVVTRQEVIDHFSSRPESYTGVILSNSEIDTSGHSPNYENFAIRIRDGVYRIHPEVLAQRFNERSLR